MENGATALLRHSNHVDTQNEEKTTSPRESKGSPPLAPRLLTTLASTLVILAYHAEISEYWSACRLFLQSQWDRVLDSYGEDLTLYYVYGSNIVLIVEYWIIAGVYTVLDVTNKPAALRRYKVQPGTHEPLDTSNLFKVVALVLMNQLLVSLPVSMFSISLIEWRGVQPIRQLPAVSRVLAEFVFLILTYEVVFYYIHRILHHRLLFKYMHKMHHDWTSPIAIAAFYSHPVEHVVLNMFAPILGIFLLGSHVVTAWLWISYIIIKSLNDHTGYHMPFHSSPQYHNFHHLKSTQCYGFIGVMDRLHGTDDIFRKSKGYLRHRTLLGLTSAREAFPDDDLKSEDSKTL